MQLTSTQKKLIWTGVGVFGIFHFAPNLVLSARQVFEPRATSVQYQKPSPSQPMVRPLVSAPNAGAPFGLSPSGLPLPDPQFVRLTGAWLGGGLIEGRGFCRLGFEMKLIPQRPGYYGYSTLSCSPNGQKPVPGTQPGSTISQMLPVSTIMTGQQQDNAIKFHIDQQIGTSADGCAITGFTVTPFGEQLAAIWQAGTCAGGNMIMQRMANAHS